MANKGVKCERIEEVKIVKKPVWLPIITVCLMAGIGYWIYDHVSGGCLGATDIFTFCEFHTK